MITTGKVNIDIIIIYYYHYCALARHDIIGHNIVAQRKRNHRQTPDGRRPQRRTHSALRFVASRLVTVDGFEPVRLRTRFAAIDPGKHHRRTVAEK